MSPKKQNLRIASPKRQEQSKYLSIYLTYESVAGELEIDAAIIIGKDKVEFRIIDAGHEFPITKADEIVEDIWELWGL